MLWLRRFYALLGLAGNVHFAWITLGGGAIVGSLAAGAGAVITELPWWSLAGVGLGVALLTAGLLGLVVQYAAAKRKRSAPSKAERGSFAAGQAAAFELAFLATLRRLSEHGPATFRAQAKGGTLEVIEGEANAVVASAKVTAEGVAVNPPQAMPLVEGITFRDSLGSLIKRPGPESTSVHEAIFESRGERNRLYDIGFRPRAVRFVGADTTIRESDLPVRVKCGRGDILVKKFHERGIVVDEIGTEGDPAAFEFYPETARPPKRS
ncbi:hypothetical protein BH24CHL6_BH24CHL6_08790 [soil metagenome]